MFFEYKYKTDTQTFLRPKPDSAQDMEYRNTIFI